jgi:hypothetical protein
VAEAASLSTGANVAPQVINQTLLLVVAPLAASSSALKIDKNSELATSSM